MKISKRKNLSIFCIPVFLCFLLFLYAPLETFVQNPADFTYDIYDLLQMMFPVFIGVWLLVSLVLLLLRQLSKKLFTLAELLLISVPLAMYVQGTFFSSFLPQLDGEKIDWALYSSQRLISVLLWGCAIIVPVLIAFRGQPIDLASSITAVSLTGTAFLLLTVSVLLVSGKALADKKNLIVTGDDMLTLSPEKNVVVLLLDMVGDPEFSDYLEQNPEKQNIFEDFTHFNNAVGGYRYTVCSIPYIFSGKWFLYQCDFDEYKNKAFKESDFLSSFYSKEYSLGIYDLDVPLTEDSSVRFVNVHEPASKTFRNPVKFIIMQLELSGLRYFPFDLKQFCVLTPQNITDDMARGTQGEDLFDEQSIYLFSNLEENGISTAGEAPCFRFIHVQGAHPPYSYDSHFNKVEDASYDEVMGSCVTLVEKLLSEMKQSGVYDSSAIVIMADHGGNDSRPNPILFVKGINEKHPLSLDTSPVIWGDLPQAFQRLEEGQKSGSIFDVHEGDQRERYYYSYGVFGNDPLIEYIQSGKASDSDTLLPTGKVYTKE